MGAPRARLILLIGPLALAAFGLACSKSETTVTPATSTQGVERSIETPSYNIKLQIGPVATMLTSEQGQTVMGQMTGMTFTDQGQPVNHHLEVHILDKSSGARAIDVIPTVRIADQATGISQELAANVHASGEVPYVLACMTTKHRETDRHFGDNLYLPDGEYTITVGVGQETAVSENIVVKSAG